jgi:hypothetical protein
MEKLLSVLSTGLGHLPNTYIKLAATIDMYAQLGCHRFTKSGCVYWYRLMQRLELCFPFEKKGVILFFCVGARCDCHVVSHRS